jgi:2-iminoacetate synthase
MSAGSRTDPGGYATSKTELEQFEIDDDRSPEEIAQMLKSSGYEPVWKDWDIALESHGAKSREVQ